MGRSAAALGVVALVVAACAQAPAAGSGITVVATTTIIADLAKQVGGPDANVESLAPAGAAVEDYQPAPEDAKKVASAKVILINGLALDRWSEKLRKNAAPDAKVVILSDDLPRLGIGESDDEDINKNGNPHYWFDVKYAKTYVERIRDALIAVDPAHADGYTSRAMAYLAMLDDLDREIRVQVQQIPQERRKLVTSHDAFPYFAKAYGFKIVGFAEPEGGKEPSAGELAKLVDKVKAERVPAIFSEAQVSPNVAQALAKDAGVKTVVTDLVTDSLGDPPADSYLGLMRTDVKKIVDALK